MSEILEIERINCENGFEIKVVLVENILTDDTAESPSRTYDVQAYFYDLAGVKPEVSLVDTSPCNEKEARKKYKDIYFGLCSLKESQVQ